VQFSRTYFESLLQHAVPLNEEVVARLSHSAMGLDIYTWMAQRLHRVHPAKPALVPWVGCDYRRMVDFRRVFTRTLKHTHVVYRAAKFSLRRKEMRLHNSSPHQIPRSDRIGCRKLRSRIPGCVGNSKGEIPWR